MNEHLERRENEAMITRCGYQGRQHPNSRRPRFLQNIEDINQTSNNHKQSLPMETCASSVVELAQNTTAAEISSIADNPMITLSCLGVRYSYAS